MTDSQRLLIFEGPDGGGKSSAISSLLSLFPGNQLHTVHHGPYPRVKSDLARLYAESIFPAVHGHAPVVLDRSWLSEPIYGHVFREGANRVGVVNRRHLERLALRCDPLVVLCLPPVETVLETYRQRKELELLENEDQLRRVHDLYSVLEHFTDLPVVRFDYTITEITQNLAHSWFSPRTFSLSTHHHGAGTRDAKVVLVGDEFGQRKNGDTLHQWPFGSLSNQGCSRWLTDQLIDAHIKESDLLWVNSDELSPFLLDVKTTAPFVALGAKTSERLTERGITHRTVAHPQHAKRFNHHDVYPLVDLLRELIQESK